MTLAFCWAHLRRRFYDRAVAEASPIANEALQRIAALYRIEADIRGCEPDKRRAVRQERSRPIVAELEPWLREKLALISRKSKLAEAIRYGLSHWDGLTRFLDDGRIEIDSNTVERSISPLALTRKNALFAGSDEGASYCSSRHVLISKEIFLAIVRRRASRPPSVGFAANGLARQVGVGDYPGRALARLVRGKRSFGDQTTHG